ncbi:MAG TPA: hypothetical protein VGM19_09610 [Armatimonadota bacterium]|jgi:hypothetical protein
MSTFEELRQQAFVTEAQAALAKMDVEAGLIPAPPMAHSAGPHSLSRGYDIRSSGEAICPLAMSGHLEEAWRSLSAVLDYQDLDPRSLTYGNFFWYSGWDRVLDPNAISFLVPHLCYVLKHKCSEMPSALQARLGEALALAVNGLNAQRITWGYTNIALLSMASKMMISDVLDDPRAYKLACWDWEEWRNHTGRLTAITEYNSLTYTWVQVHALAMMLSCPADEVLLREVRMVMRQLITSVVVDYHPVIGRITGPQSRAYLNDRRYRGRSHMDAVLHYVLGTPLAQNSVWLGAPIGPEDILPPGRNLSLPRTTRAATHGFSRTNYLAPDFALGAASGRAGWIGHEAPFFLAYRAESPRCTVPIATRPWPHASYASLQDGLLLGGSVWLLDATGRPPTRKPDDWRGVMSGLNTGRPDDLLEDPTVRPGYVLELGLRGQVRVFGADGQEITDFTASLAGAALALETESVVVGLRFLCAGDSAPTLSLGEEEDGEIVLTVRGSREGRAASARETATFGAFLLDVQSRTPDSDPAAVARRMAAASIRVEEAPGAWQVAAPGRDNAELTLALPFTPDCFYSVDNEALTANQWAASLREAPQS